MAIFFNRHFLENKSTNIQKQALKETSTKNAIFGTSEMVRHFHECAVKIKGFGASCFCIFFPRTKEVGMFLYGLRIDKKKLKSWFVVISHTLSCLETIELTPISQVFTIHELFKTEFSKCSKTL